MVNLWALSLQEKTQTAVHESLSHVSIRKKKMSSDIFHYINQVDEDQLQQMKLTVDKKVQDYWHKKFASDPSVKLDDDGDELLHALVELLCSSTDFKQLVPAAPSAHQQNGGHRSIS